jgi:hypothetical protein
VTVDELLPLSAEQVGKLRQARAFWHGCDNSEPLPFPSREQDNFTRFENHLRAALEVLCKMSPYTRDRLVQFLDDPEMRGVDGIVDRLLYYADAAAEAKEHRHGSAALKSLFGTADYLSIYLIADFYFQATGIKAAVHWDYDKEMMVGDFLNFVSKAYGQAFEGDAVPSESTIREALSRAKRTDRQQKAGTGTDSGF